MISDMVAMPGKFLYVHFATSIKIYIFKTPSTNRTELFKITSVEAESIISKSTCATDKKRKESLLA